MSEKKTIKELKTLPPKERIAGLKEIEQKRREELEEKQKEIEEAEKLLRESLEEAKTEEKKELEIEELAKERPRRAAEEESELEETVAKEKVKEGAQEAVRYGAPLEDLRRFYESVREIRNEAAAGNFDKKMVEQYQESVSRLEKMDPKYAISPQAKEALFKIKYAWQQIQGYSYIPEDKQRRREVTGY